MKYRLRNQVCDLCFRSPTLLIWQDSKLASNLDSLKCELPTLSPTHQKSLNPATNIKIYFVIFYSRNNASITRLYINFAGFNRYHSERKTNLWELCEKWILQSVEMWQTAECSWQTADCSWQTAKCRQTLSRIELLVWRRLPLRLTGEPGQMIIKIILKHN